MQERVFVLYSNIAKLQHVYNIRLVWRSL